jgi:hypothetical protein
VRNSASTIIRNIITTGLSILCMASLIGISQLDPTEGPTTEKFCILSGCMFVSALVSLMLLNNAPKSER